MLLLFHSIMTIVQWDKREEAAGLSSRHYAMLNEAAIDGVVRLSWVRPGDYANRDHAACDVQALMLMSPDVK